MTTIYFVRHAEPDYNNHDDFFRPLTDKGLKDRIKVTNYLLDKKIDVVLSSPYVRAFDTVADFAKNAGLNIETIDDFRERKVDSVWVEDFKVFCQKQWSDFNYKLTDGETLNEVQKRNIEALEGVLEKYKGKNIVVGSHGTALSMIINCYDNTFNYENFAEIVGLMPWVVKFEFDDKSCISIEQIDL
jgi:2,3-bisphosphoglycerate-dependent phosphoglycerate mutase